MKKWNIGNLWKKYKYVGLVVLAGILSRYILEGRTKGMVWPAGVEEGIYLAILRKFQELFRKWCQPLNQSNQQE